ncbi:MAG TPA: CoA ester lyase [Ferrovibrio sp.]|jgi:citrate lyase subunit beta/citryl-CoA lyase|uniref:HpcH/HpaI aldolase/citrate lyase family protein n=1 Tax=Ferrovibrio sp. TaxID=1917215 RepID=UPI002ED58D74
MTPSRRAVTLRRSWHFLPGADRSALAAGPTGGADVLIQELEDFTPPAARPTARTLAAALYPAWRAAGRIAAARINPLDGPDGEADLAAVMDGAPDLVMMPKVDAPEQIVRLDRRIAEHEVRLGLAAGSTEIVPNIESALGLTRTIAIAQASRRVTACLVASEDMVADLGAVRSREGIELAYVRQRFLIECRAAGVVAIDCPYTFGDSDGAAAETRQARQLGYTAKAVVRPEHAAVVNAVLTPSAEEIAKARRIVEAFETARGKGEDRASLDGHLIEKPTYTGAQRLLARAAEFGVA